MSNTYKLYFYTKTKNADAAVNATKNLSITFGSNNYDVILLKLKYTKKTYQPCEINATLTVDARKVTENEKTTYYLPTNSEIETAFLNKTVDMDIDGCLAATNYFVYSVKPIYNGVSGTSMTVELGIYSADKLMTLDKYSRAYTAKRLYTDILATESSMFHLNDDSDSSKCTKLSTLVANHMQLLKYKASQTKDNVTSNLTLCDELRIPYVVQYNESFYNFLARTANRYGEFLYFEDGKLNLGMQPSETNYYKLDADGNKVKNSDDSCVAIDWAMEPNAVQSRWYQSVLSEGISVKERAYNFINHTPDYEDAYADDADERYNIDPVSTNEWTTQKLKKNEYHEYTEILGEEMKQFIPEVLFKAFEATSFGEGLSSLVLETLRKIYEVWNTVADYNNQLDKVNWDKLENDDQKSGDNFRQFVTYSGSSNLSNNIEKLFAEDGVNNFTDMFYQVIRKHEKEIGEKAVWLDFGNYYKPIKLGDMLLVNGVDYVVISVEGSYEDSKGSLLVSALPVYSLTETTAVTETTSTTADPWTNSIPFPSALSDVVIRDARPQVAFVAETLDPENLGRIRVRYPWQDEKGDASPWIRVTLPLATKGGAVNFTPCEGDEVMVGYEHGNIDRPYGMGYLAAPFVNERWKNALPIDQYGGIHGIRTKTGHHLTFEDGFALLPMVLNTLGPTSYLKSLWPVGATGPWPFGFEETADLGGGFELADRYGFYKISGSTDERSITIESPAGTVEVNAFQGISINAPNGDIEIKGKNVSISASNQLSLTSGENIKDKLWYQKKWEDGIKGKFASLGAVALAGGKDALSTLGEETIANLTDVAFIRCLAEWLIRPINGTLQIKSYTFVTIEAGEGKAELPPESLRKLDPSPLYKIYVTTLLIGKNVYALIDNIRKKYDVLCDATAAFVHISGAVGLNKNASAISYSKVVKKEDTCLDMDSDFTWEDATVNDLKDQDLVEVPDISANPDEPEYEGQKEARQNAIKTNKRIEKNNRGRKRRRERIRTICEELRKAAFELKEAAKKWTDMKDSELLNPYTSSEAEVSEAVKKIKAEDFISDIGIKTLDDMKNYNYDSDIYKPIDNAWMKQKISLSRYIIYKYLSSKSDLKQDKTKIASVSDAYDNDKWRAYVNSLEKDESLSLELKNEVRDWFTENMIPFRDFIDDQRKWKHGFKGKILLSEQEGRTASFDDNLNMKAHVNQDFDEQSMEALHKLLNKA